MGATSGVSAAMGFYYYLKNFCHAQVTWAGEQLNLPSPLPAVPARLVITTNDRYAVEPWLAGYEYNVLMQLAIFKQLNLR